MIYYCRRHLTRSRLPYKQGGNEFSLHPMKEQDEEEVDVGESESGHEWGVRGVRRRWEVGGVKRRGDGEKRDRIKNMRVFPEGEFVQCLLF